MFCCFLLFFSFFLNFHIQNQHACSLFAWSKASGHINSMYNSIAATKHVRDPNWRLCVGWFIDWIHISNVWIYNTFDFGITINQTMNAIHTHCCTQWLHLGGKNANRKSIIFMWFWWTTTTNATMVTNMLVVMWLSCVYLTTYIVYSSFYLHIDSSRMLKIRILSSRCSCLEEKKKRVHTNTRLS